MLIVMSDLHFADTDAFNLNGRRYNHNLPSEVYKTFFKEIAEFIRDSEIESIDLVLAGDIFEITRSALWLEGPLRPYLHNDEVTAGSQAEIEVLRVIDAINRDNRVDASLNVFRGLSEFFQKPVYIHFVPGNHDRLANASETIRKRVQGLLGLEPDGKVFANQHLYFDNGEPLALVRHGHEYDKANFSADLSTWSKIPMVIEKSFYDKPVLGDIVTIEIAAKLPLLFKDYYGVESILAMDELRVLYKRLIDFDNLRPSNALINFLFTTPGMRKGEVWQFIEPIMLKLLDDLATSPDIGNSLINFGKLTRASAATLKSVLRTRLWRHGLPFWAMKTLLNPIFKKSEISSNLDVIMREESIIEDGSSIKCIVSGHSHNAMVELLEVEHGVEKYYINSGTFRNVITSTPTMDDFGRLRSKARVLIFNKNERNPEYDRETSWSFDFNNRFGYGSTLE
ncbi:MAG: metallophosphoesterase [Anaerolineaceae bacterium]|jgi:UDP-2,3-diacylglucosamine pyrophosphatase LpxH|nr:metallophosphoesterase [Anaerolineaceae bacterium]MDD4042184.1 metallophosphoesterase [Anaerolineaceae bacterium]MDD4577020.1 metallophosphoesterase [Anaerolineaceae bacterium]